MATRPRRTRWSCWIASVDGDDAIPDVAPGRLTAKSIDDVSTLVDKILAYESGAIDPAAHLVLMTDDADEAGDFERNADELSRTVLGGLPQSRIHLSELGAEATRREVRRSFDEGTSLVSYIGHGGIHLWASENVFNTEDVSKLGAQPAQPIVLTMNCLNGYFHFP